jgi:DNA invertase Pin-like site-specific DNA recombinase
LGRGPGSTSLVVYEEKASVAKARPVLDRLVEDARTGKVRAVVVVALDRLDRDMRECINRMAKLDGYGCKVLSVREAWVEDAGHTRGLLVGIFGWMNEMERRTLIERTKAGLARARREGKRLGRPRLSYLSSSRSSARSSTEGCRSGRRPRSWGARRARPASRCRGRRCSRGAFPLRSPHSNVLDSGSVCE